MSTTAWDKLNKYYLVLIVIIVVFIGLCIYTGKTVIDSVVLAYQYDMTSYKIDAKVDQARLDTAYKKVFGQ